MNELKTPIDQLVILNEALKDSPLESAITGAIYLAERPDESKLEDVVINGLPVSGSQIQLGVANVNIYVPDFETKVMAKAQKVPNLARLNELTKLALPTLKERYRVNDGAYVFTLASMVVMQELETGQHYMNLRIDFQFFPIV